MTDEIKHGTYMTYFHRKCRCDECRRYQRERVARNRAERLARGVIHGSRSSYDAGCRCDSCVAARRKSYSREREAAKTRYQERKAGGER
jgi:hypothetical protein